MRVNPQSSLLNLPANNMAQTLTRLLAEQGVLRGVVRRVTSDSVFVFLEAREMEVELPLPSQGHSFVAGQGVELTKQDSRIALGVAAGSVVAASELVQDVVVPPQLEQVLVELNIPPTEEALMVAQGLVENGFPLQESLVWALLPWAENGYLEEAILALQARYPLKAEVLELIRQSQGRDWRDPIVTDARSEVPTELQEWLEEPNLEGRASWSDKFSEGKVFKALTRLLVEERLVESLLGREHTSRQSEFVLALPFFRGNDLYASWVRITREQDAPRTEYDEEESIRVTLEVPTVSLGLVGVELLVQGRRVGLRLKVHDHPERLEGALEAFGQQLAEAGWKPEKLQVRRWDDAQSGSLTV